MPIWMFALEVVLVGRELSECWPGVVGVSHPCTARASAVRCDWWRSRPNHPTSSQRTIQARAATVNQPQHSRHRHFEVPSPSRVLVTSTQNISAHAAAMPPPKKSGKTLMKEEGIARRAPPIHSQADAAPGLERTDNSIRNSWPVITMINQKNYYTSVPIRPRRRRRRRRR